VDVSVAAAMSTDEISNIDEQLKRLQREAADAPGQDLDNLYEALLWSLTRTRANDPKSLLIKLKHFRGLLLAHRRELRHERP